MLASLQTFYNFAGRAETQRVAAIKYKTPIRELEQLLTGSARQWPEKSEFLNDIRQRLDDLELEAPVVAESSYRRIEERYNSVVFSDKVAALVRG